MRFRYGPAQQMHHSGMFTVRDQITGPTTTTRCALPAERKRNQQTNRKNDFSSTIHHARVHCGDELSTSLSGMGR